ncbi:VanZ family protein [Aquipuribacter sp. MA13-6]|uniref:VanZ family protein n=1 Tax=unclassified Aquipuribacter TaxID=2635084 RepID=UPI003EE9C819
MHAPADLPAVVPVVAFLTDHVVVLPALLVLAVGSVVLSGPLSRRLGSGRSAAALLSFACTAPFAMTLPPSAVDVPPDAVRDCVTALRPLGQWGRGGEELANVLLTLPAGLLLVVLLPRGPVAGAALAAAAGFPLLVEGVQYAVPALGRSCEATDVLLNLVGLVVGAVLGLALRPLVHAAGRRRALRGAPPAPGPLPSASPGTSARP